MKKTLREAERIIIEHLKTQRVRSKDPSKENKCLYRGPNGLKCAVGVLIDDEHFSEDFNSSSVDEDDVLTALDRSGYPTGPVAIQFYRWWQERHDSFDNWYANGGYLGPLSSLLPPGADS